MAQGAQVLRQGAQQVVQGGHKGQGDGADVDRTVVAEELAKQSQQDEARWPGGRGT